jgi:hypothetical protein
MADHRGDYKLYLNKKFSYLSSFEILQYNDAYIELLFEGEFSSRNDLDRKEGGFQRSMECVNKNIAGRTKKEHYEENKDEISVKGKKYRKENPEKIKERSKKYYANNKPKILEYQAQYYDKNQEKVIERAKDYREEHLDQIHARRQQTYKCECGSINCIENKARHESSVQHQTYLNSLTEIKQEIIKVPKIICVCGSTICINDKKRHERSQKHQAFIHLSLSAAKNFVEVRSSSSQSKESSEVLM